MNHRPPTQGQHKGKGPSSDTMPVGRPPESVRQQQPAHNTLAEQYDRDKKSIIASCFAKVEQGVGM
jgi:hypothetical protein